MKMKTLTISMLLLAVILAPLAMAEPGQRNPRGDGPRDFNRPRGLQGHPGMGGDMGGFLLGRMAGKLELTDDQKADIKAITEGAKAGTEDARKAITDTMKALHEATTEGSEAEIIAAGKAVGDAFIQQALLRRGVWKRIKEVLTEEQTAQLKELKAQMKERMQQYRKGEGKPRGERGEGDGRGQKHRQGRGEQQPVED